MHQSEDEPPGFNPDREYPAIRRILSLAGHCYLDQVNPAAAGHRTLMGCLARHGFTVEVLSGTTLGHGREADPSAWLAARGWAAEIVPVTLPPGTPPVPWPYPPSLLRLTVDDIPVALLRGPSTRPHPPDDAEAHALLSLLEQALDRFRPELVIAHGVDRTTAEILRRSRSRGLATVLRAPNCDVRDPRPFALADAVIARSRFDADYLHEVLGRPVAVLPDLIDRDRIRAEPREPRHVTFIGPSPRNGLPVFARIADELGRARPDVPLLVVAGPEGRAALDGCGLDLRARGNVHLMAPPRDPRRLWERTRIVLVPSLDWASPPSPTAEALVNGLAVVASDRGSLPETLGDAGVVLPLPDRLTPAIRSLPTAGEVAPWVEAILRLWDDADSYAEYRRRALEEARRLAPEVLEPRYAHFFAEVSSAHGLRGEHPPGSRMGPDRSVRHAQPEAPEGSDPVDDAIGLLAREHPWPSERPVVSIPIESPGWLASGTDRLLARELSSETRVVVELGAWLGLSTRFIADHAPNAVVISVDHWRGSPEHRARDEWRAMLPGLYDAFLSLCWDYRARVIPLRMTTLDGLRAVADRGLEPDLIFIDAEHSYEAVAAELALARELFPRARLVGDDYDWPGVQGAVGDFALGHGLGVERVGERGWKLVESTPAQPAGRPTMKRLRSVILVPHLNGIEPECEEGLRQLERAGLRVVRRRGSSQIDVARNEMASDALHDGFESLLFIDADIGFDPLDSLRLLARPEPVLSGVYAKKHRREMASNFAAGVEEIRFGPDAPGPYPLQYAATGFLRVQAAVLRRMIERLGLILCNRKWGRGSWPFFQPVIVPHPEGGHHYLGEDWAFSHRLAQIGVTPLADTTIRLWHYGSYGFGWEDAGAERTRSASYRFILEG